MSPSPRRENEESETPAGGSLSRPAPPLLFQAPVTFQTNVCWCTAIRWISARQNCQNLLKILQIEPVARLLGLAERRTVVVQNPFSGFQRRGKHGTESSCREFDSPPSHAFNAGNERERRHRRERIRGALPRWRGRLGRNHAEAQFPLLTQSEKGTWRDRCLGRLCNSASRSFYDYGEFKIEQPFT